MIIVSDFDGVLGDSINECLFSSYNAYQSQKEEGKKIDNLNQIDRKTKDEFIRLRPYIKGGESYLLIFYILENNIKIETQEDFDRLKEEKSTDLPKYKEVLYKERDLILKKNPRLWLDLNPLFDIGSFFDKHRKITNIFILSTKRKEYIIKILKDKKIDFPEENIFYCCYTF